MAESAPPTASDLAIMNHVWMRQRADHDDAPAASGLGPIELVRTGGNLRTRDGLSPRVVTAGWACRRVGLPDGRRQIIDFVLPGDILVSSDQPLNRIDAEAITPVRVMHLDHDWLKQASASVASELEARLVDHIVRLGRHTAYERTLHLLLEFHRRLSLVGLTEDGAFAIPLTQAVFAEALGLSIVHVNRILQQLRDEHVIDLRRGTLTLLQKERLQANPVLQPVIR